MTRMLILLNKATALKHCHSLSSAPTADEPHTYSTPRILLHWLSAAVILWATFSGFSMALLAPDHPFRQWVESLNPQLTSLFIPFFAWRLWLALRATPKHTKLTTQERIASSAHKAIYAVVSGVLITGVLMMSHPVILLALVPLPQLIHSQLALLQLHQLHHLLCVVLAGLVALHLAAVVMHHLRGKPVLGKMLKR